MAAPDPSGINPSASLNNLSQAADAATRSLKGLNQLDAELQSIRSTLSDAEEDIKNEFLKITAGLGKQLSAGKQKLASDLAMQKMDRIGQESYLKRMKELREKQIDQLVWTNSYWQKGWKEFVDKFRNSKGEFDAAHASKGIVETAKAPKEALLAMAGPWGALLDMIISVVDKIRKTTSELHKASAASGHFADGLQAANEQAATLVGQQAELAMQGLSVEDATKVYVALKNTGIQALGVMDKNGAAMSHMAKATEAFAKTSGESIDEVAGRFASFIRNFGVGTADVGAQYLTIIHDATSIAQDGIMTMGDYMKSVTSLGDAFADVGINIGEVSHLVREVGKSMKSMGLAQKDISAVAQGILGLTKAADGWKVMMAKMSGVQGGFAESLYSFEQRGEGFDLTKMGKKDIGKMVGQGQSMLNQMTGGISDAATRRLIQEQIGGQIGMDPKTLQVFQKLESGAISQEEAGTRIEKLWEQAKAANMSSKDMFDIIKDILTGIIAKPIAGIYKIMTRFGGGADSFDFNEDKKAVKSAAVGATIKSGGMLRVHAEEMIVPAAKTGPYRDGNGGSNISIGDIHIAGGDPREVSRAAGQAVEQKIYEALARQQKSNFVG